MKQLILGGARSGKSTLAQRLATESGLEVVYLATADRGLTDRDPELRERIDHHRRQRPAAWALVEEPLQLAAALRREATVRRCLLVDCLTLWLTNLTLADPPLLAGEQDALLDAVDTLPGQLILVANEVGLGIVPLNADARRFRDLAGRLHQRLAERCDRVLFTVAGLPLVVKDSTAAAGPPARNRLPDPR